MSLPESKSETTTVEHVHTPNPIPHEDVRTFDLSQGYVIDAGDDGGRPLKLAADGHTVLIPQPSNDLNDPINWSTYKKHLFLIIISATAFLPDFTSAVGAITLLPQVQ